MRVATMTPRTHAQMRDDDTRVERPDPVALDPYSPTFPVRAVWNDPDPLALDPYSPVSPSPADTTE